MRRLLLVAALALGLTAVPLATVQACSCAMIGGPDDVAAQAVRDGGVAFIGTVVDAAPAPADPDGFGGMVGYAFELERASVPISAAVIEVRALDDGGGASCGFTFGRGETWFVSAYEQDGALHTGLCNGNTRLGDLAQDDADRLREILLPVEPDADPPAEEGAGLTLDWVAVAGATLLVGAILLTVFAFLRDSARRPG
jgi:hypothetical protein